MKNNIIQTEAYKRTEEIRSFEVNSEKNMNIAGIARKLQEMAWEHSSRLNYGYNDLIKKQFHWVLARTEIQIHRLPVWTEFIELSTWPSGLDGLFFVRDFEYKDQEEKLCISGSSDWLIINERLRPQIPNHVMESIPIKDKKALGKYPEKLTYKTEMEKVFNVHIRLSDLDPNYHTNNVRYYQWTVDCLAEKNISDNNITRIEMNFLHESKKSDDLEILYAKDENAHWVKGKRNGKQDVFLCRVETIDNGVDA